MRTQGNVFLRTKFLLWQVGTSLQPFSPSKYGTPGGNSRPLGIIASGIDGHRDSTKHDVSECLCYYPESEIAQAVHAVPRVTASTLPCTSPASLCFVNVPAAGNFSFPTLM